jgi:4-nitrophenyl phosphatase
MLVDRFPNLQGVILDMDGVLWKDTQAIGNLPEIFNRIMKAGLKITLATNNATRTTQQYLDKLQSFGVFLAPWQIVNSAEASGFLLKEKFPQGGLIYIVGEPSLHSVLATYGFESAGNEVQKVLAVVAGMDRTLNYEKLRKATLLIRNGAEFIGTNPDQTFPTPEGLVPGAGSILAALETATGVTPIIAGKPEISMFKIALSRLNAMPENVLCIGDRLETDILGGQKAGCKTALVLSGVTSLQTGKNWVPAPDFITQDLSSLFSED